MSNPEFEARLTLESDRYVEESDDTFEFAKSWAENKEIFEAGARWARKDALGEAIGELEMLDLRAVGFSPNEALALAAERIRARIGDKK